MSKTVQPSKQTEWKGLDRISVVVHEMGNIWREMTKDDFGLDGEIEVVTPKANGEGFETAGGIVKVQSKAGESYVRCDTETSSQPRSIRTTSNTGENAPSRCCS